VATLVDLSRVRIFGGVTAREAARLVPGTKASIGVADLDGRSFEAELVSVARVAKALDGTYEIELSMDNPGGIRDGMVVGIELRDASGVPVLLAPRAALLRRAGQTEVFVVDHGAEGPVARVRSVRTGRVSDDSVEIQGGLVEGEDVVFDGHFALKDGARVVIDGAPDPASAATASVAAGAGSQDGAAPASPALAE
jgi:multidrug efflux pump subunit AcrA (membrane-fusion protein)